MSQTFERVRQLIAFGEVEVSEHGYDELSADGLTVDEIVNGVAGAEVVEDYPTFGKGPCVLLLQRANDGEPIHVLWGIPKGHDRPTVLITAYRPDPAVWSNDFRSRKP